jgi:hypothetical protein
MEFVRLSIIIATAASLTLVAACGPKPKGRRDGGGGSGAGDLTEAGTPVQAGVLKVETTAPISYETALTRKFPANIEPECLAATSYSVPTLLAKDFLGIRYMRPEAILNEPYDQGGQAKVFGWAVQVFPNLPGNDFPADYSQLTADTLILEEPDFDGNTAPDGATTANFALRAETAFEMPVGRTIDFQVRALSVARLTIDGEVIFTTATTAAGGQPPTETYSKELSAGHHIAVVEFKKSNGNAIFELLMKFSDEDTFRPMTNTGATPFSVLVANEAEVDEDAEPFDPNQTRLSQWPSVAGTENITTCIRSVPDANHGGYGERSFVDATNVINVRELSTQSMVGAIPVADIKSIWTAPRTDTTNPLRSISFGEGTVGVSLSNNQTFGFDLTEFLPDGEHGAVQSKMLGAHSSPERSMALIHTVTNLGSYLLSIIYDPASGTVRGLLRQPPSDWPAVIRNAGILGEFALITVDGSLFAIKIIGSQIIPIETGVTGRASILGESLYQLSDTGMMAQINIRELGAAISAIAAPEAEAEADPEATEEAPAPVAPIVTSNQFDLGSDYTDLKSLWVDPFSQVWALGEDLKTLSPDGRGLAFFYPNNGKVYFTGVDQMESVDLEAGSDVVNSYEPTESVALRSNIDPTGEANWFKVTAKLKDGTSFWGRLSREALTGDVFSGGSSQGGDGPIVQDPINPTPESASYATDIAPMIERSCLGGNCHSGGNPAGGLPLETKDQVQVKFGSVLGSVGPAGNMPLGRAKLNAAEIELLRKWRDSSYPD